jgi:Ca-activated chloride channel family protein
VTFAHLWFAILAVAIFPASFLAQRVAVSFQRRAAFAYSNLPFLTAALRAPAWPGVALDAAAASALSLLLLAAAHPRYVVTVPAGATLAICLDTSGSMNSRDVTPTRAQAALAALRSFAFAVPSGTRIGVVAFAGTAQIIAPPSSDRDTVFAALAAVPPPNGQTAIGDGLAAASTTLPASGPRGIVLVTDGTNNRGEDPGEVANRLRAAHVRLDIIGVGPGALSELTLRAYAREAGGSFVRIRSADQFPTEMKRVAFEAATLRRARDCSPAFAIAGLFLITAAWVAAERGAFRL